MKNKFLLATLALTLAAAPAFAATAAAPSDEAVTRMTAARDAREAQLKAALKVSQAEVEALQAQAGAKEELVKAKAAADGAKVEAEKARLVAGVRMSAEPVTFLGVMTSPAPSALTSQLGRPAGMGLVVVSVQAKSPADGVFNIDDLLLRLDDQKLINNDQLTALIRGHEEGEEVTLTYVRGGKEATAKVKLVKQVVTTSKPVVLTMSKIAGQPNEETKVVQQYPPSEWKIGSTIQGKTTIDNGGLNQTFTYTHGIGGGTTEIKIVNGKKTVTTRNSDGGIEFTGPYDTEEERKAAPPSVQIRAADAESRINEVLQVKAPTKVPAQAPRAAPTAPKAPPVAPVEVR